MGFKGLRFCFMHLIQEDVDNIITHTESGHLKTHVLQVEVQMNYISCHKYYVNFTVQTVNAS